MLMKPSMDFVFKRLFGAEESKDSLISLLNAIIKSDSPIKNIELKSPDLEKQHIGDKFCRLDIKAKTDKGEIINVEIQVRDEYNMVQKTLYYWSKIYSDQLGESENYKNLARTVCINILNFKLLDNDRYHNTYRLKEITTNEELTDIEEIHFIELPKSKEIKSEEVNNIDSLLKWIEFIKEPESETVRILELTDETIRKAKTQLYKLSLDKKTIEQYRIREKALYDEISALENSREKGRKEGLQEGEVKGELKAKKKLAKSLLDVLDIETISKKTSLSIEEIRQL
ncbi:PD-(D/E)XK nuclease family transposase [Clostridium perfringens]|uniref:PD-(D/E)XK nuclease family transposase n=1 Tax=Clostridium perfringens TaxID=1502 RepID=A0A2X3KH22_CLOPF|nr:Rpn family recombination-promoting nuclease/putative transposase [Clostridium perfringens]SQC85559.1 PD-(D/E)XK nuclease family transposase [Clostridium perfringens]